MRRLETWPCAVGGAVRHMFALACLESRGPDVVRIAADGDRWALVVVHPGRVLVPCGDGEVIRAAGSPSRRWRLLVGDVQAAEPVLGPEAERRDLIVHRQRFLTVDGARVPSEQELPDPGLRRAVVADLDVLASLAVQLHVDDQFGPDPGRSGLRGYRERMASAVGQGLVWVVGPVGAPVCKVERSFTSERFGVQLAGIVVTPQERGQGLGTAAVTAAVRAAMAQLPGRPVSLHVRAANTPALAAYATAGFVDREEWRLAVRP